ncbi:hypothetical protein Tco_1060401 [Tanacetum coccineum]
MATQQDIFAGGFENRPLMLSKDDYVQWSSRMLRYCKSKPNGKLIYKSILEDELTENERKQVEADDQAIHILLLGLPADVYDVVDSCDSSNAMWHHIQRLMKGTEIRIQERSLILLDELDRFTSTEGETIGSYFIRYFKLINDLDINKLTPSKIATTLKFNRLQPEWAHFVTRVKQTKDLHEVDYNQLYDCLKQNHIKANEIKATRLAKTHDPLALYSRIHAPYVASDCWI